MNGRCYKCNNPLTTGDFDGMCNNCRKQQNDTEISIIEQALTELERLKKFKETFDNYELAKKQDFIVYENWIECEAELKVLKEKKNEK